MSKKIVLILSILAIVLLNGCSNTSETDSKMFDFSFTEEGTIIIQGLSAEGSALNKIVVPKEIGGKEVTHIGDYAFEGCDNLVSVILKENIKSIGKRAFASCIRLEEISFPNDIEQIGLGAFEECGLLRSAVPDFSFVSNEEGNIIITGVLKKHSNTDSKELVIPGKIMGRSVKKIGDFAFKESYLYESVVLEDGIEEIGRGVFCGAGLRSVTLPNTLQKIGDSAFERNIYIECLKIPESVSYIGSDAFKECINLEEVNFPDGLTYLGRGAFESSKLKNVTLPKNLAKLEEKTFYNCSELSEVIAVDLESIGNEAFRYSGLKVILLSDKLTDIGENVFPRNWFNVYTVTIIAPKGSVAELYAEQRGINVNTFGEE